MPPDSLRILHLIPTLEGGGAERQLTMLADGQARSGHDVHLGLLRLGPHARRLGNERVEVHRAEAWDHYDPRLALWVHGLVRRLRPNVVQTWLTMMDILGGLGAFGSASAWVLTERASALAYAHRWQDRVLRRGVGRFADAVVANSATGLSYWTGVKTRHRVQVVIRNAIDLEAIRAVRPAADWPGKESGHPLILFAGRLAAQKNVGTLIRALALLKGRQSFSALIVGQGPDDSAMQALVDSSGLQEMAHFSDYREDLSALMKVAHVLVSPSRFEGHPNVVLEAIACGLPVIVSDIPEHREFLDPSCAELVPQDDAAGLAAAMERALADPDPFRARARVAESRIAGLSVESAVDAYDAVYRAIVRRP